MMVQAGPAHADLCTHYHHYCQQLQGPVAILFHFCFACVVHFHDFKDFVHPQFYNFRATNNRNCKSKSSKLYYQMVVDERYTKPLTRPLLFHAPTVETRNAPELDWDAPCCDVVSSPLPIQRPANILWWSPSSLNHPPQWWSSWHLLWQLITLPIFRQWQSLFREKLQPIIIWTEEIAIIGSVQSQIDED